jgi:hypothetical protein
LLATCVITLIDRRYAQLLSGSSSPIEGFDEFSGVGIFPHPPGLRFVAEILSSPSEGNWNSEVEVNTIH